MLEESLLNKKTESRKSPGGQWLGLHASTARDMGLIPGWGTQTPHAAQCQKKKKKNTEQKESYSVRP